MAEVKPETDLPDLSGTKRFWPARWRWRISLVLAALIGVIMAIAWFQREQIAANLIDDALADYGLEASYEIEEIGARRQVIRNLVIGDKSLPDFTAERLELDIAYTYGPPQLGVVTLVNPRLFGEFTKGQLSFGSLDAVVFAQSDAPAGLPQFDLRLVDGRARIATDYGVIGVQADGAGRLDDGFAGTLAATAPGLGLDGCSAAQASLFGDLATVGGALSFDGPIRFREASCDGASIAAADVAAKLTLDSDFSGVEGDLALNSSGLSYPMAKLGKLAGRADFALSFGKGAAGPTLNLRHDLNGEALLSDIGLVRRINAEGTLRSRSGFARNEWSARINGEGIDAEGSLEIGAIRQAREASKGTFASALLTKFEGSLSRALSDATMAGDVSIRAEDGGLNLVVPEARLKTHEGDTLIAVSRLNYANAGVNGAQTLTGNLLTGGAGLPQINARLDQESGGAITMRMAMAPYASGGDALTIPRLSARRDALGKVHFDGLVKAKGAIPGGALEGIELPIEGGFSARDGLALGTRCLDAQVAGLTAGAMTLGRQTLSLCPLSGRAMVQYRDTLSIAAQLRDFAISGDMGDGPVQLAADNVLVRYPGTSRVDGLAMTIGAPGNGMRFAADSLDAMSGEGGITGRFSQAAATMDIVPLNIADLSGEWSFADDIVRVDNAAFTVSERLDGTGIAEPRFEPLQAEGASLSFEEGVVRANAELFHPFTSRGVAQIAIRHELASAKGRADITVPGLGFDEGFQPQDLTGLTKGLIAFADGVIEGNADIAWDGDDLSSTGTFSTNGFDFAAAFGPVRGVKGSIEFTDLLGMTTAPSQLATIASVNPGVEALDGLVVYSITNGTMITIEDGRWPFMGGELMLRPVELDYGGGKGQNYIFEIIGLDAATFVAQMELANMGATGKFDGTIPIIFDAQGNGTIEGGLLISRPPGGNVSYVGELTYEDLGAMGNYAFQTLRSLDYNQMSIELNGNLAGEIITNFNIDGVRQGQGASQNFVTRQLAKLPIRFKVNVRSENFYTLATIVRGIFDPTVFANAAEVEQFVGDNVGALQRIREGAGGSVPPPTPAPVTTSDDLQRRAEPSVQPSESEDMP